MRHSTVLEQSLLLGPRRAISSAGFTNCSVFLWNIKTVHFIVSTVVVEVNDVIDKITAIWEVHLTNFMDTTTGFFSKWSHISAPSLKWNKPAMVYCLIERKLTVDTFNIQHPTIFGRFPIFGRENQNKSKHSDVQSLLCLFISISLASILPFCVSLCLCVWQGAWLLLSRSRSDTPAPNSCQSPSPYKPGRRTTSRPDYCVFMLSSCATLLGFSSSSRPGSTSQPAPCRSARHSTSPAPPAVPPGIYLSCSPCRSSRYLPLLLTLPFQPESTSPALINSVKSSC